MIDYSLGARLSKPNDKNSEKKVYAYAQARQVIDIMALARHIQVHGSPYTRDIIVGVLTKAVDCIREQLLEGNKVQLGEMGAFYVTLRSTGADSADDFNAGANITGVNVRWERGKSFEEMIADASFRYVATREKQAEARKAEKQAIDQEVGNDGTSGSGSGNNGGQADPGDVTP